MKQTQPPVTTCSPPVFKCIPPPNYSFLKQLVLHDFSKLHFTSPRFISLRHPNLYNLLVRAKIAPTDNQFIDIITMLDGTPPATPQHMDTAALPYLHSTCLTITPCQQPKCATCKYHLTCSPTFKSTHKKRAATYHIRHQLSCNSTNVIYLITCSKCKKQYVGCTTQQLNTRINHHRSNIYNKRQIYISKHFNLPNHTIMDMQVQPIDQVTPSSSGYKELHHLEQFWIKTLHTLIPHGLNVCPSCSTHIATKIIMDDASMNLS